MPKYKPKYKAGDILKADYGVDEKVWYMLITKVGVNLYDYLYLNNGKQSQTAIMAVDRSHYIRYYA
jgi:hypothetical protein